MTGQWIQQQPQQNKIVIFVHGILSSSESCWTNKKGAVWFNLLKEESELKDLGIYIFSYNTSIFSGTYNLNDVVDALKTYLKLDKLLQPNKQLIFVCHSMGGIVVRKFIVERQTELINLNLEIGLFLVASPSLGSDYANLITGFAKILNHTQADALRFSQNNIWLNGLDTEFINFKEAKHLPLIGKELIEDKPLILKNFLTKQIVEPFSGARYFGEHFKVANSDHSSIAKPENKQAIQHRLLCEFIKEFDANIEKNFPKQTQSESKLMSLDFTSEDFKVYELAELKRIDKYKHAIERTLSTDNPEKDLSSNQLLLEDSNGAIILASSGLGKTTLCYALFIKAIENRQTAKNNALPFDIPLPEFAETKLSIIEFMRQRIDAHYRGMTEFYLKDLLCNKGAILFCDSFDRLSNNDRIKIEIELKNFLRDFSKSQIFVFSRGSNKPYLPLSNVKLKPFNNEQKELLLNIVPEKNNPLRCSLIRILPKVFLNLCDNPLLLDKIVEYCKSEERLPTKLIDLFQFWLDSLLDYHAISNTQKINQEMALILLAKETINAPISKIKALKLLREQNFIDDIFDKLLACDAIQINGSVIDLQHEALADYLRALSIIEDEKNIIESLANVTLDKDSLFPVLLMALLPTRNLQRILWQRLSQTDLSLYLTALKYRADISKEMIQGTPEEFNFQYLEDVLEGLEMPLLGFFPQLQDIIKEELLETSCSNIGIVGCINTNHTWVDFSFQPVKTEQEKISYSENLKKYKESYGVNLKLSEYRLDSGRILGTKQLKKVLLEIIKNRKLKGGKSWASERLVSRLRFMSEEYKFPLDKINLLSELETKLEPNKNEFICSTRFYDKAPKFYIKDLLEDINYLKTHNETVVDFWWLRLDWKNRTNANDEIIRNILNEHFRRLQLVYKEIIENSFPFFANQFGFYNSLPVRWDLVVSEKTYHRMEYRFFPVASWGEAGANIEFSDISPDFFNDEAFSIKVKDMFKEFNRKNYSMWCGSSFIPDFNGLNNRASFVFDGETSVLYEVCELITNNINNLFSELPSRD